MSSHRKVARKKQTGAAAVLPVEKKRAICVIFMEKWQKWELGKGLVSISENGVLLAKTDRIPPTVIGGLMCPNRDVCH